MIGPGADEIARRVVGRLAPPEDAVVLPFHPLSGDLPEGVSVYDVRWPPPGRGRDRFRGAAVVDGSETDTVLDLDAPSDLGRLVLLLWGSGATLVAEVIARYARRGPFDIVITLPQVTAGALEPSLVHDLGCASPTYTTSADGRPQITFCSFRLYAPPDEHVRAAVDAWTATQTAHGTITIETRELADGLPSPRYALR
jgi:hypothetical protein